MKKTNKVIITSVIAAMLLLGVGYAAIQNITLNIEGTATADPSQSNFSVKFTGTPKVSDSTYVTAGITDDINATISVSGLTQKGQTVSAEYTVQNVSTDISADLSVATTNSNTEYFTLKSELAKTSLTAGEATTVKVTVELTKTPIAGSVNSTIGVRLTAMPVEPGKEGTSEGINGSSQTPETNNKTTLAEVTNANIGEYIDLGNNIVGTEATTDDWRILYKDEDKIYAILADYLPNSTGCAENAELNAEGTYVVNTYVSRDKLINGLTHLTAWNVLANGIAGATVTGAPTLELVINSYNAKNNTDLAYNDSNGYPTYDYMTSDHDLYTLNQTEENKLMCYWIASSSDENEYYIWSVQNDNKNPQIIAIGYSDAYSSMAGVRPVVALPSETSCSYTKGIWTIEN